MFSLCGFLGTPFKGLPRSVGSAKAKKAFREYITNYAGSDDFRSLVTETKQLKDDLSTVKYCVLINGTKVKVLKYESEIDYSVEVEETFEKFKQGAVKDYLSKLPAASGMNHVEAKILDLVAKLYPDIFSNLDDYYAGNAGYLDETIAAFDREIQFYVAYLEYVARMRRAGLKFCYPKISNESKEVYDYEGFDLALASKLIREGSEIARQIVSALLEKGVKIFFVTHLYEFSHSLFDRKMTNALFLRAERGAEGKRTYKLVEGEPLETSHGQDSYNKIFGAQLH